MIAHSRGGASIGPVLVVLTALGTDTERSPGPTSTAMPSTVRPPSVIPQPGAGRAQVSVS